MDEHPARLKVVFLGTSGEYTLYPLRCLSTPHEIVGIVESAHRRVPPTRRRKPLWQRIVEAVQSAWGKPSLWTLARQKKLPYFYLTRATQPELAAFLRSLPADVGVICSSNHLLPAEVINIPRLGFLNLHPSLLPRLRGPFVWFWLYHQMEPNGGVSLLRIDTGEDTGDLLAQASFPIEPGMAPHHLIQTTIHLGARLLLDTLDALAAGQITPQEQRHLPCPQRARYLKPGEDLFDWPHWSLEHTYHFLSGCWPWYRALGAQHGLAGLFSWRAEKYEARPPSAPLGRIRLDRQGFYFAHPEGRIRLRPAISPFHLILWTLLLFALLNLLLMQIPAP